MYANVEIKIHLGQKLVVPEGAIIDTGIRQLAIIDKGNGYFEPREVKVGVEGRGLLRGDQGTQSGRAGGNQRQFPHRFRIETQRSDVRGWFGTCWTWKVNSEFRALSFRPKGGDFRRS